MVRTLWELRREGEVRTQRRLRESPKARLGCVCVSTCGCVCMCVCVRTYSGRVLTASLRPRDTA